jgi:hypothetical protein
MRPDRYRSGLSEFGGNSKLEFNCLPGGEGSGGSAKGTAGPASVWESTPKLELNAAVYYDLHTIASWP